MMAACIGQETATDQCRGGEQEYSCGVVTQPKCRAIDAQRAIPIIYQGQTFPSLAALACHLAPLTDRSVTALKQALHRHKGDLERVLHTKPRPKILGNPIVYQGQQFPSRRALAQHLAPLTGRSVAALQVALSRHKGDLERVLLEKPRRKQPPLYQGQQFPSMTALAEHLAPLTGRSVAALQVALSRHKGNLERTLQLRDKGKAIPAVYRGQQFPSLTALAKHLAPLTGLTRSALLMNLSRYDGNVERVLAISTGSRRVAASSS